MQFATALLGRMVLSSFRFRQGEDFVLYHKGSGSSGSARFVVKMGSTEFARELHLKGTESLQGLVWDGGSWRFDAREVTAATSESHFIDRVNRMVVKEGWAGILVTNPEAESVVEVAHEDVELREQLEALGYAQ